MAIIINKANVNIKMFPTFSRLHLMFTSALLTRKTLYKLCTTHTIYTYEYTYEYKGTNMIISIMF